MEFLGFSKPAGSAGDAQVNLRMDAGGNVRNADFVCRAGLRSQRTGRRAVTLPAACRCLDIPSFRSGANDDFALSLTRDPVLGISASMTGHSFDGENLLISNSAAPPAQSAANLALRRTLSYQRQA